MEMYLCIITTILVITQVIRVTQNSISLYRQNKVFKKKMKEVEEISDSITAEDINRRREIDILLIKYLKNHSTTNIDDMK